MISGLPPAPRYCVGRQCEELAVQRVGLLGELAVAGVAGRHVQPLVGAEGDPPAVVDPPGLDALDQRALAPQPSAREAPALELHARGGRVVEVDEAVAREVGIEREAEQAALALSAHGHRRHRLPAQPSVALEQAHAAGALGDERTAIREEGDLPGISSPGAIVFTRMLEAAGFTRERAAVAAVGVGAALENPDQRLPAVPAQLEKQRRGVVAVVELAQAPVGVDAMHEHVAPGGRPVRTQVLALESGLVVVAVADRDALLDAEQPGSPRPQRLL